MSLGEYDFNCLDDALQTWHCHKLSQYYILFHHISTYKQVLYIVPQYYQVYSIVVIGCHRSSTTLALKCQTCRHFCHFFLTFGSTFVTWSSAPGVSMPESVFRKTVHGAPGTVFRSRQRQRASGARSLFDARRMGKAAIEPTPLDTKQKAALRRLERVTGALTQMNLWNFVNSCRQKWEVERDRLNTVERNLWICGHCAEGSIRPKLRHTMNYPLVI